MKKMLVLLVLVVASSTITFAQRTASELDFEKNRSRYTREHFSEGEDASSGFDYVYFRDGKKIVMIRSIWSASHTRELRIDDMYFNGKELIFVRNSTAPKSSLSALKAGRSTGMTSKGEMHFEKGKLTKWIEGGKTMSPSALSWEEAEKSMLDNAKSFIENYADLKKANR